LGGLFIGVSGVPNDHAVKADRKKKKEEDESLLDSNADHVDMET
jgi:hypothetical protein